jgi:hypothetical protein
MSKFIKAESGPGKSVVYTDSSGKQWKYEGGSRPWRNQNPGNLVPGNVSKRNGAIGKAGGFSVFPDYESGHGALLDSLKNVHGNKDITDLMNVYAPPKENDTKKYIKFIRKKTGIKGNKKIRDFTSAEFENLWLAIEQMEGWGKGKEGKIIEISVKGKITGVKKDKNGIIQSYQIEGLGWVTKKIGIALALKGKVDAVVANSSRGNRYLRARPNSEILDNLETKG